MFFFLSRPLQPHSLLHFLPHQFSNIFVFGIMVVAFGWSVSDVVAGIWITAKICETFRESGSAAFRSYA